MRRFETVRSLVVLLGCLFTATAALGGVVGVGFVEAPASKFQFVVAIGRYSESAGYSFHCTGTRVDAQHIVTAAHCVTDDDGRPDDPAQLIVAQDVPDLALFEPELGRAVATIAVHPDYDTTTIRHDIAVLTLSGTIDERTDASATASAYLRDARPAAGFMVEVAGFGSHVAEDGGLVERVLRTGDMLRVGQPRLGMATIPIVGNPTCQAALDTVDDDPIFADLEIDDSQLCAGFDENSPDPCQGDSGGPLIARNTAGQAFLLGVVSYGVGCGRDGFYGVYTRLAGQGDWLARQLGVETSPPSSPQPED